MIIRTNTGKEIGYSWTGISELDFNLYIGTLGLTVPEAVAIFCNPEETAVLTLIPDEENSEDEAIHRILTGYTRFMQIRINPVEGTIIVGLGRQEGGDIK